MVSSTSDFPVRPAARFARVIGSAAAALLLALAAVLGVPSSAAAVDEGTILTLTNQSRAGSGLGPLKLNAAMSQVALGWAKQMASNGAISHNPNYSGQIPGGWSAAAENVASGYPTGSAVHQGWMVSSGHRANILGDFTDIGIAHVAIGGTTWSVEVFAKYGGSVAAPKPAPKPKPQPAPKPAPKPEAETQAEPQPKASAPIPSPESEPVPATSAPSSATPRPSPPAVSPGPSLSPAPLPADASKPTGGAAPDDSTTKLVLGIALLLSLGVAATGWIRFHRAP